MGRQKPETRMKRVRKNSDILKRSGVTGAEYLRMRHWATDRVKAVVNRKYGQRIHIINEYDTEDLTYNRELYNDIKAAARPHGFYISFANGKYHAMSVDIDGVFEKSFITYADALAWLSGSGREV